MLASAQAELSKEATAAPGQVFHYDALDVGLEVEQVDALPVGPIQGQDVPAPGDLGATTEGNDIQVGEDAQEQLLGQPAVDERLVVFVENASYLPMAVGGGSIGGGVPV